MGQELLSPLAEDFIIRQEVQVQPTQWESIPDIFINRIYYGKVEPVNHIVWFNPKITVKINKKTLAFPYELEAIAKHIEDSKELLLYKADWNENGAIATDITTYFNAANFIHLYSSYVLDNYSTILATPYIDLLFDGSISVRWETPIAKFLIIFEKKEGDRAFFYCEKKAKSLPLKGAVEIGNEIDADIANWMKNNLTSNE